MSENIKRLRAAISKLTVTAAKGPAELSPDILEVKETLGHVLNALMVQAHNDLSTTEVNHSLSEVVASLPRVLQAMSPVEVVENHGYACQLLGHLAPRFASLLADHQSDARTLVDVSRTLITAAETGRNALEPYEDDIAVSCDRTMIGVAVREGKRIVATLDAKLNGTLDINGEPRVENALLSHPMVRR